MFKIDATILVAHAHTAFKDDVATQQNTSKAQAGGKHLRCLYTIL